MEILSVDLENYRNYNKIHVDFHKKANIILGSNGQGKTNLLESIYLASFGKSFRASKDKELIKFNSEFCRVSTHFLKDDEPGNIDIAINKDGKKGIKVDGVSIKKVSQLMENIYVVIFSPEDLKIIKDEPSRRRSFIDRELCKLKISYFDNLSNYKKVLLQRNTYLKGYKIDDEFLTIWDIELAKYGAKIISQRKDFIKKLSDISKVIHKNITGNKEELEIRYMPNIPIEMTLEALTESFQKTLVINRHVDKSHRTTSRGPHKDDLKILINNIDCRKYGSQGQQRTAALSLKLAEIELIKQEKNENPILLLDDVMSELDSSRQNFLIETLSDIQMFITTTELTDDVLKNIKNAKILNIKNASIDG
ncbi:MAG: DNA replication/repair protein RecF [Anaerovoracaceae bacterium]